MKPQEYWFVPDPSNTWRNKPPFKVEGLIHVQEVLDNEIVIKEFHNKSTDEKRLTFEFNYEGDLEKFTNEMKRREEMLKIAMEALEYCLAPHGGGFSGDFDKMRNALKQIKVLESSCK